ncbi:glycosyltransferase [Aureimonas altamirensis]|uniref:glycosyltransferase n=1 Tax=Aureimonas altamirensis TaxID=370622 RepID=UPI002557B96E|nr:glycosyltransferase [Aureimonas altamirensis]
MEPRKNSSDEPLVSIIIPVFNGADYLSDAIDSALAQTYSNVEIIIVNDGSDDNGMTEEVIRAYGDQVRSIHKENGGVASALNAGISAMRGTYFSWLSHDDIYLPRKVERQLAIALAYTEPTVVYGNFQTIDASGHVLETHDVCRSNENASEDSLWLVLEVKLCGCAMLVPSVCIQGDKPFDERLPTTQDYVLWFELAREYKFVPCGESLVQMRLHSGQGSKEGRHIEEASIAWIRFCSPMPERLVAACQGGEYSVINRLSLGSPASVYRGFELFLDRLRSRLRGKAEIGIAFDAAREPVAGRLGLCLRSEGFKAPLEMWSSRAEPIPVERLHRKNAAGRGISSCGATAAAEWDFGSIAERLGRDAVVILPGESCDDDDLLASDVDRVLADELDCVGRFSREGHLTVVIRLASLLQALQRTLSHSTTNILQEVAMIGRVDVPGRKLHASMEDQHRAVSAPEAPAAANDPLDMPSAQFTVLDRNAVAHLGRFELTRLGRRLLIGTNLGPKLLRLAERAIRQNATQPGVGKLESFVGRVYGLTGRFDKEWYIKEYPDVAAARQLPILHYLSSGWREGRKPFETYVSGDGPINPRVNPVSLQVFYGGGSDRAYRFGTFWATHQLRRLTTRRNVEALIRRLEVSLRKRLPSMSFFGRAIERLYGVRGLIDREWYLANNEDVRNSGIDPSIHYLLYGWREGRNPRPDFQTAYHMENLPELGDINPLSKSVFLGRAYQEVSHVLEVCENLAQAPQEQMTETADLLLFNAGDAAGRAWITLLEKSIGRRVQFIVGAVVRDNCVEIRRPDGTLLGYYDLAINFSEAIGLVRGMGVRRVDVLGCELGAKARDFLDALQVPYDLTALEGHSAASNSQMIQRLARGAARLQVPCKAVADAVAAHGVTRHAVILGIPGAAEAANFPVQGPVYRPTEKLRVVAVPATELCVSSMLPASRHLHQTDDEIEAYVIVPEASSNLPHGFVPIRASRIIDAIGAIDPHLIWIHGADAVEALPKILEVLGMGRPTLATDCAPFADLFSGRPYSWALDGNDYAALAAVRNMLSDGYRNGTITTDREPTDQRRFDRSRYLSWL